ncbi:hypothetical protein BDN67DRAFT_985036 [Paxillus ammoniavirescens]|nr:hypothetical protein BDN67DRAFT_985036 [Paxillus ammoniavirescens]
MEHCHTPKELRQSTKLKKDSLVKNKHASADEKRLNSKLEETSPRLRKRKEGPFECAQAWSCVGEITVAVLEPSSNVFDSEGNESYSKVETNTQLKDEARLKAYHKKKLDRKLCKLRRNADDQEKMVPDETPPVAGVAKGKDSLSNPIMGIIDKALTKAHSKERRQSMSQVMEPAQQIASKSYLGQALDQIGAVYVSSTDSRVFHRFMTEGMAYIEASQVKSWEHVFILSHYLEGRAHEFYI